jgi:hypothetical protein
MKKLKPGTYLLHDKVMGWIESIKNKKYCILIISTIKTCLFQIKEAIMSNTFLIPKIDINSVLYGNPS